MSLVTYTLGFSRTGEQFGDLMRGGKVIGYLIFFALLIVMNFFLVNLLVTIVIIYIDRVKSEIVKESDEMSMLKFLAKKWRKFIGKPPKNELKFMHRNYTMERANFFKETLDAQVEFIYNYIENFPEMTEELNKL
jgi:hypothetical protein